MIQSSMSNLELRHQREQRRRTLANATAQRRITATRSLFSDRLGLLQIPAFVRATAELHGLLTISRSQGSCPPWSGAILDASFTLQDEVTHFSAVFTDHPSLQVQVMLVIEQLDRGMLSRTQVRRRSSGIIEGPWPGTSPTHIILFAIDRSGI